MVRACAVNPGRTTTVGLCLAGSLTGLGGCLVGMLNTSSDINLGSGMVTVALASLIIGATVAGGGGVARRVAGVVLGACLYRIIIALAIQTKLVPTEAFKLVSAVIVAVASASPQGKRFITLQRQKLAVKRKEEAPC